eukprot:scaffold13644_cov117-Isochrysis_galbana.AAC.5
MRSPLSPSPWQSSTKTSGPRRAPFSPLSPRESRSRSSSRTFATSRSRPRRASRATRGSRDLPARPPPRRLRSERVPRQLRSHRQPAPAVAEDLRVRVLAMAPLITIASEHFSPTVCTSALFGECH